MLSTADISYVAVNPQQQGCGIGKALMTHIIDYCKSQSLNIILASTAGTSPSVEAKYLLNLDRLDIACIKKLSSSINALGSSKSLHPEWWQMARFKG
jgi:GNAT superfamily N-acetyltransferase